MGPRLRLALHAGLLLLIGAACAWFLRGFDFPQLGRRLAAAELPLVIAATATSFVHLLWRALRLRVLLWPVCTLGVARLYRYTLASCAASNVLPARAGEALRVWLLRARDGVPVTSSVAAALLEKWLDMVGLLVLVVPVPWLLPSLPPWLGRMIAGLTLVAAVLAAVGWAAARHGGDLRWLHLRRFAEAVRALGRPRLLLWAVGLSILSWITDAVTIVLVLRAVHADVPLATAPLVLLTLNLAIAVPSTPAQVGAFEMGAVVALRLLGVDDERAFAFALLYHAVQVVPVTLIGIEGLWLASRARREEAPGGVAS